MRPLSSPTLSAALSPQARNIVDVFTDHESYDNFVHERSASHDEGGEAGSAPSNPVLWCLWFCRFRIYRTVRYEYLPSPWVALSILGVLSALFGFAIESAVGSLLNFRLANLTGSFGSFLLWTLWTVSFAVASTALCRGISTDAEGSGIPEMRVILSGTPLNRYLSMRTGVTKIASIITSLAAGLSVGKEGPFVHIACALANSLCALPTFRHIKDRPAVLRQVLGAAVAAGVTAVFGAPVGGVLFSIEVTMTHYRVGNLWRAFICAVLCVSTFEALNYAREDELFAETKFTGFTLDWQLIAFTLLGLVCGLLGSAFVYATAFLAATRRESSFLNNDRRYVVVPAVALLTGALTYSTTMLRLPDREVLNSLFSAGPVHLGAKDAPEMTDPAIALVLYFCVKFFLTTLSVTLPISSGLFTPVFVVGAALGRLYGEGLTFLFDGVQPGAYAMVAAAALTSGATHTLSTAVIVFELTGQLHHMLPVLLGVVVSYVVSSKFTLSIYDVFMRLRGLPNLPVVHTDSVYRRTAQDLMDPAVSFLTLDSTFEDAANLLARHPKKLRRVGQFDDNDAEWSITEFALVNNAQDRLLIGTVHRDKLEKAVFCRTAAFTVGSQGMFADEAGASAPSTPVKGAKCSEEQGGEGSGEREGEGAASDLAKEEDSRRGSRASRPSALDTSVGAGVAEDASDNSPHSRHMAAKLVYALPHGRVATMPRGMSASELVPVDRGPFLFPHSAPLGKVHYMFTLFPQSQAVVTKYGRYAGLLMKADLARRRAARRGILAEETQENEPRRTRASSAADLAYATGVVERLDEEDGRV